MILVSACLLGENCKYSGGHNRNEAVLAFLEGREYIPFCPEQAGGLPTPRLPSEIRGDRVVNAEGIDVTDAFRRGADKALEICLAHGVDLAVLKESSPSCGIHRVYDGTFSGQKIDGMGMTARRLRQAGIAVMSENDI